MRPTVVFGCGADEQSCTTYTTVCHRDSYNNNICATRTNTGECCPVYIWPDGTHSCCDTTVNGSQVCHTGNTGCSGSNGNGNNNQGNTATCGDGTCNGSETCGSCPQDCGACPVGNVQIRAIVIPSSISTCSQVNSATNYIAESVALSSNPAAPQMTPTDGTYATWTDVEDGTIDYIDNPPAGDVLKLACYTTDGGLTWGTGYEATLGAGQTLTWNLGYTVGAPWIQTGGGGDVYGATNVQSYIPAGAVPRYFALDGAGGTPGVVTYGAGYDFDSTLLGLGEAYVSSQGWLVNETYPATDYYAVMYHRFGSPADADADYTGETTLTAIPSQPPKNGNAYYVSGDLTIGTNPWVVGSGQSIVILVSGNLTINEPINITPGGFIAFIVNGDVTVDPSVGVPYSSSAPVVEGVYITSPTGTFHTGLSSGVGVERFVGKGTFIAGNFSFERNLEKANNVNHNGDTSANLFIYNPQLLLTMPDMMKDIPITWQEVAP